MSALKKEDLFKEIDKLDEFVKSFSDEEKIAFVARVKSIKEKIQELLHQEEDTLYYGIVNKSLEEDWENEKDDAYNDL